MTRFEYLRELFKLTPEEFAAKISGQLVACRFCRFALDGGAQCTGDNCGESVLDWISERAKQ